MTSLTLPQQNCTINVPFHGTELYVVNHNGEPYTPMKPIVEGMGMVWASQFVKLKQRFAKGVLEIEIPSVGGIQKMICLALRKLAAWLNTISPNKVKPEIRDNVIRYQEECDDVLYEYWTKGQVTNPRKTSTDERTPLRDAINLLVGKRGIMYPEAYSYVHQRFGVSHIEELPSEQLAMAVEYIHRLALEGELMPKEEVKSTPAKQFSDEELVSLCYLQLWMEKCQRLSKHLYPSMRQLGSDVAGTLRDIAYETRYMTNESKKALLREADNLDKNEFIVKRAQPMLAMLRGEEWIH
ncbi:phage antirepressor N-terminal domain-containing protein [Enterobacter cloacae complex sp. 2024EL-00215]|uniref:phage antirepressor N-terminal domain-containing protein n=1 Tax=unclassified Enterobacter cloacae complex TaxID=2757714 RepID=UPI0037506D21